MKTKNMNNGPSLFQFIYTLENTHWEIDTILVYSLQRSALIYVPVTKCCSKCGVDMFCMILMVVDGGPKTPFVKISPFLESFY